MKMTLKNDLELARTLNKGGWAILTATMEAHGNGHSPRNVEANECLAEYLDEQDYAYVPLTGTYKGVDQGASFLILEIELTDAIALAARLRQESILSIFGMCFVSGWNIPRTGCFIFGKSAEAGESFSRTENGLAFRMNLERTTPL
jgi:hypothetical protein